MITEDDAINLLNKYGIDEKVKIHSKGVSEVAFETASEILRNNPSLNINPYKVKIAALLHDIGKSKDGLHEINSIEILKKEGLEDVAKIVMHGLVYELFILDGFTRPEFLPVNLENKIVIFSDLHFNQNNERVSFNERINDIIIRHKNNKKLIKALNIGMNRLIILENEISKLIY